jgi:hypothetical protein
MAIPQRFLLGQFLRQDIFAFLVDLDAEINKTVRCDLWIDSYKRTQADYAAILAHGRQTLDRVNSMRTKAGMAKVKEAGEKIIPEMGSNVWARPHTAAIVGVVVPGTTDDLQGLDMGVWAKAASVAMKANPRVCHSREFPFVFWIKGQDRRTREK